MSGNSTEYPSEGRDLFCDRLKRGQPRIGKIGLIVIFAAVNGVIKERVKGEPEAGRF